MKFVIIHGSFGSPEENWFPELKEKLESTGQEVIIPRFPTETWDEITASGPNSKPKNQSLKSWLKEFEKIYKTFKPEDKLCFIGHSLGPLFILQLADRYNLQLDSAIFVSPFLQKLNNLWQFDLVNGSFYKTDFDFNKLRKLIPVSYVLYSDNDPYVSPDLSKDFAQKLGSSIIFVKRAGHMNSEVNLNEFPLIFELCKTRLDLTLYQKYIAHRRELFSLDYIKDKTEEEVIYLKPGEVFDEGIFKFRNLKKEGFCTFFTGLTFWDTQSKYYEESRRAAKRIKDFSRVFVVDKISDLKRLILISQIDQDIKAGVKVYLVMFEEIKDLDCEPDFGLWDNEYLCVIKIDQNREVREVQLSSRREDIKKGSLWKKKILEKSQRVYTSDSDIKQFIQKKSSTTLLPIQTSQIS